MLDTLALAVLSLVLSFLLGWAESCVCSGRAIGLHSLLFMVCGMALAFFRGPSYGLGFLGAIFGLIAMFPELGLVWLASALPRRLTLEAPRSADVLPNENRREFLKSLIGQVGQAKNSMLPGGVVRIAGHDVDAVSEGMPIEEGEAVEVIDVRGGRLVVRGHSKQ